MQNLLPQNIWIYIRTLYKMARPSQLLAITLVMGWGYVVALARGGTPSLVTLLFGYLIIIPISASIHYANEYADYETDRLTTRTPFSGGSGALHDSGLPRSLALISACIALIFGTSLAIVGTLVNIISPISLIILGLGTFFGWIYSLPPLALAWKGWGELTNATLGGILLPAYAFSIHTHTIDLAALLSFLPFGMLAFVNLLATTWPDRKADAAVGKYTLATHWPVKRLRIVHICVSIGALLISFLLMGNILPSIVALSGLVSLPALIWGSIAYTRTHSPFPTVVAMVIFLIAHLGAWLTIMALW